MASFSHYLSWSFPAWRRCYVACLLTAQRSAGEEALGLICMYVHQKWNVLALMDDASMAYASARYFEQAVAMFLWQKTGDVAFLWYRYSELASELLERRLEGSGQVLRGPAGSDGTPYHIDARRGWPRSSIQLYAICNSIGIVLQPQTPSSSAPRTRHSPVPSEERRSKNRHKNSTERSTKTESEASHYPFKVVKVPGHISKLPRKGGRHLCTLSGLIIPSYS